MKKSDSFETQQQRYDYWVAFQDYAFQNVKFAKEFKRRKPSTDHWINYFIGSSECYISVSQIRNRGVINVALYIPDSKQLYRDLLEQKEDIERTVNIPLSWYELPERKASKIIIERVAEFESREKWKEQFNWIIDVMVKMKKAFKKYL